VIDSVRLHDPRLLHERHQHGPGHSCACCKIAVSAAKAALSAANGAETAILTERRPLYASVLPDSSGVDRQ
jgi:hypothetical protein